MLKMLVKYRRVLVVWDFGEIQHAQTQDTKITGK